MSPKSLVILAVSGMLLALFVLDPAFASTSGGNLPWEGPLQQIQQSITGPVAGFIALAAVAVAGGMLIFGGELNDFARRLDSTHHRVGPSSAAPPRRRSRSLL